MTERPVRIVHCPWCRRWTVVRDGGQEASWWGRHAGCFPPGVRRALSRAWASDLRPNRREEGGKR